MNWKKKLKIGKPAFFYLQYLLDSHYVYALQSF